ncbi:hypothetical protein TWF191_004430 [Orbilia oligospora]|uniref:Acyltransferase MbtK/IucB-like conserved domain-containing protein n=1 Tax=Orbilia oligospora TaxID=2813651 RepID=A0A7C8Q6C3_ORBOL|nr:hypothetical protein TWF191_004430 [Orbilia oligospora]
MQFPCSRDMRADLTKGSKRKRINPQTFQGPGFGICGPEPRHMPCLPSGQISPEHLHLSRFNLHTSVRSWLTKSDHFVMGHFDFLYLPTDPPVARSLTSEVSRPSEELDVVTTAISILENDNSSSSTIRATLESSRGQALAAPNELQDHLKVQLQGSTGDLETVWTALYWYFQYTGDVAVGVPKGRPVPERCVELILESDAPSHLSELAAQLERLGLVDIQIQAEKQVHLVFANVFWQLSPELFLSNLNAHRYLPAKPLRYTLSNGAIRHPNRPLPPPQRLPFYTRHCISDKVNSVFKLRPVDMSDLDLIHKWMNNTRVSEFWGEQGPIEHQKKFLETCLASKHSFTAIGSWNDLDPEGNLTGWKDACFFDIYWVKEDHLARYANSVQDWDRGVHLLVGEDWARGRSTAWLDSIVHFMFLSDPRTQSIYLEPRVDNELFIRLLTRYGFYKVKDFAFPHKQAALMKLDRDHWKGCR